MKKILLSILILVLITACTIQEKPTTLPGNKETPINDAECQTNDDCTTGGCSGIVCQSKDTEPVFSTCEYSPSYDCYKTIDCGCIQGKCQWQKTEDFNTCVKNSK
ncbi:MAG: eight-cysteine-cluster domain-containing protein [Candidatus Woesearchaeota archaeon]|jgi:eight-cysteine-cluster-containing protein|nr:eight-cysteine-cluster domain-containing protein [Candidatus Woesearchaeota archaeon]MDP7180735.1 eight-cysteine-cluster domain-containing protein [Candidatus Woesearchaeota archaeon]|tara:strand:+ start:401 stop:715 length:315 start_codon:yes stop_codon:yes gene_type:complete